jgi:recombination associated protein RdgC
MWFNNVLIFNFSLEETNGPLESSLEIMKSCPPHARFIYGWLPAVAGEMTHEIAGATLICMGKEERILPSSVIKRVLEEKICAIEANQNRTVKRAEKAQLAEELEFELLPKSFCVQKKQYAILDHTAQRLLINTASATQASQLISLLRKSVSGFKIEPYPLQENLIIRLTEWINNPETLPSVFQLASECQLINLDDDKKRFTCKGYELPADEVISLLSQGLAAAEVSLIWNERIQFTLTHDMIIKRIKCLDLLVEDFHETKQLEEGFAQQDAALTLLAGELRALTNDLISAISTPALEKVTPAIMESVEVAELV